MDNHRVYGDKIDINVQNTIDFYNDRAKKIVKMDNPYISVMLGDQNPEYAIQRNQYEDEFILPKLEIDENSIVLDIGCGMGRWAEKIIPKCGYYLGVDFSSEMINVAKQRSSLYTNNKNFDFISASFQDAVSKPAEYYKFKFNRVIIAGVCMYINDMELSECICGSLKHLDEHCIMYLSETAAVEQRLTLNEFSSDALKTTYDAIYRTPSEYNEFYKILIDNGFELTYQEFLPHTDIKQLHRETDRFTSFFVR